MTLLIGFAIGIVLGLTGAGGSVLAVPLLAVFLDLPATEATGLALGVVAASSLYGAAIRIIQKQILWVPALLFGISGMLFAPPGRWLSTLVDPWLLKAAFAALSAIIAARMFWQSGTADEELLHVRATSEPLAEVTLQCVQSGNGSIDLRPRCLAGLVGGGVATGLLSGFFGVGGGFLIIPLLTQINRVPIRHAIATSLLIIAGISASGFAMQLLTQPTDMTLLPWLAIGGLAGMIAGHALARHIAGVTLQRIFAVTILLMAILLLTTRG